MEQCTGVKVASSRTKCQLVQTGRKCQEMWKNHGSFLPNLVLDINPILNLQKVTIFLPCTLRSPSQLRNSKPTWHLFNVLTWGCEKTMALDGIFNNTIDKLIISWVEHAPTSGLLPVEANRFLMETLRDSFLRTNLSRSKLVGRYSNPKVDRRLVRLVGNLSEIQTFLVFLAYFCELSSHFFRFLGLTRFKSLIIHLH